MATKSAKTAVKTKKKTAVKARRKAQEPEVAAALPPAPPVVGIGASAGGLEAFTQLLGALPLNTGMAFVLIQHLEPKHQSVLTALLSRATTMPIAEITQGMRVEPNHVYVIPANADLTLVDGTLKVVVRKAIAGRHAPIDYFLRSLAETQGPRAVGVILSGTASDGTAGVKAIKEEGGTTFAQDPDSARFDGMPRSAIATGCVDFVLPPERIATELARIVRHPFAGLLSLHAIPHLPANEDDWTRLFRLLRTATGVDFRLYKQSTIKRRMARRMAVNKVDTLAAYHKFLERNPAEVDALLGELLIPVTDFFRDPEVFDALRDTILPQLLREKPPDEPIRIWSAGCATGQETYSLAIALLESLGDKPPGRTLQIFGSDVSDKVVEQARLGVYSEDEIKGVSKERRKRFFRRVNGEFQVEEKVREMCVFARHDLIRDPPFSRLDLLSCRNVLIYFDIPLQRKVLSSFHYGLRDSGVLLLGKTESLGTHSELFSIVDRKFKVFRKNLGAQVPYSMQQPAAEYVLPGRLPRAEVSPMIDLEKEADQMVWERASFAGLVVNDDLHILHFRGDTSAYLRPAPGKASLQLMRILREEIVLEVRSAIQKVRRTGKTVRAEGIEIRSNHHVITVNVEICLLVSTGPARSFLILFEPALTRPASAPASRVQRGRLAKTNESQEVVRLRADLVRTREYVQSIIRDQETANEELKTANEEALSSMEELQSTNEELETAKEELQSSNEELVTLNEQLQNRNSELGMLSNDLGNVLSGIDIPVVLLDANGRIRRFTPTAEKLLGLIGADVGRPIGKLRLGIHVPDMEDLLATVIARGKEQSRELQTDSGHWFQLRMRPFRRGEEKVEGVLLAFVDIHLLRERQEALQSDRNFISAILDAANDLLVVVLDPQGRIVHFNHACQQLTGYTLDEAKGRYVWDFLVASEEAVSAKIAFTTLDSPAQNQRQNHWIAKNGRRLLVSWSHTVAKGDGGEFVIVTGIDVTELQLARRQAEQSGATVLAVMENSAQAILACGKDGRIVIANPMAEKMFGYPAGALFGQPLEALLPERFRVVYKQRRDDWFAESRTCSRLELAGLRQDGSEFPVEVSLSSFAAEGGVRGVAFVSDITERKKNDQMLLDYKDQLQKLTGALISARELGNREIARELHDVFGQELAALGMEISSLRHGDGAEADLTARLSELGKRVRRLADNVHETSRKLHPAILEDLGLLTALKQECESFEQRSEIPAQFVATGVGENLPLELSLTLYRVAQECLRNIQKHAPASDSVQVTLIGSPDAITLRIADTGDGFDLDKAMRKGGLGLISMEERVRTVNGKLTVESEHGKGTTVAAFVPLEKKPE
ncbi:MAG TPA: chemotaxis protein CheB [Bryobacteraceae bacterium]|nr:chemotaxis protein CheB [Bryobacteraceae bacterium]